LTEQQQEEIHLSGIALHSARADLYNCEQRMLALEAEMRAAKVEHERLERVVKRADVALSRAKSAAKKRGKK
jgi:hypothetical protein